MITDYDDEDGKIKQMHKTDSRTLYRESVKMCITTNMEYQENDAPQTERNTKREKHIFNL